jgi:prophage regulatory protein
MTTTLYRLPAVRQVTGLSRSQLYRLEAGGKFPGRVKLSQRASAWRADEVEAWVNSRPRAANQTAA